MLVHICCSVDSHFFFQKLQEEFPDEKLTGFFYDPNIHPFSEYQLRLLDVQRSCKKLGIELLEGEYDFDGWLEAVKGLEEEPEKGKRCSVCFDGRLERTAQKALEMGEKSITTTLLASPKKSLEQLRSQGQKIQEKYSIEVLSPDFRKNGGSSEQFSLAKRDKLYHQNYCGCLYALLKQREAQGRFEDELSCPIGKEVLPASIEERIMLYECVIEHEAKGFAFRLQRQRFLNYRLLFAKVLNHNKEVIPSFFLFYSQMRREYAKVKIQWQEDFLGFANKEELVFVSLELLNSSLKTEYSCVKELMFHPPTVKEQLQIRKELSFGDEQSLHPIIVVDDFSSKFYEIILKSKTYTDVRENLVKIR